MAGSATFQQAFLLNNHLSSSSSITGTKLCTPSLYLREKAHDPSRKTLSITCTAVAPSSATPRTGFSDPVQDEGRVFNFAAGPATLPENVIKKAQAELYNWSSLLLYKRLNLICVSFLAFLQIMRSFSFRVGLQHSFLVCR